MKTGQKNTGHSAAEQRAGDRRRPSWLTFYGALFLPRRRTPRRDGDHFNSYVDWYGYMPLIATILVILLCFADAFLTTVLLNKGAVELNVLMDWLIQRDIHIFAIVKMAVTGTALIILVMHFNFRIYRFIAVRFILYALVPLYAALIYYELGMIANMLPAGL